MEEMNFMYDGDKHTVIYIEYKGLRVHSVITMFYVEKSTSGPYWRCCTFDFEWDCKKIERFMYYHSGSGGEITELQAPRYVKEYISASYWMHPKAKFKGRPKNIIRRKNPIKFKGDPNPFNNGREIYATDYCKICKKYYDEDACPTHHVVNDGGILEYADGSKVD